MTKSMSDISFSSLSHRSGSMLSNRSRLWMYGGIVTTAFGASYFLSSKIATCTANENITLCLVNYSITYSNLYQIATLTPKYIFCVYGIIIINSKKS